MRAPSRLSFIFVLLAVFLIGAHSLGWLRSAEDWLRSRLFPAARVAYQLSVRTADREEALRERYRTMVVDEARQQALTEENQELRAQLNFLAPQAYQSIGADVVGRSTDPLRQTRWINRGASAGVVLGAPVIAHAGILVGKVIQVEKTSALVQLLTDHQSRVAATVTNREQSLGIIEGGYGISIRMNFIPQHETVPVGDTVITSGLEPLVPRGLVIGTVEAVEKEAYQPFQRASVTPLGQGEKIRAVSVILNVSSSTISL